MLVLLSRVTQSRRSSANRGLSVFTGQKLKSTVHDADSTLCGTFWSNSSFARRATERVQEGTTQRRGRAQVLRSHGESHSARYQCNMADSDLCDLLRVLVLLEDATIRQ